MMRRATAKFENTQLNKMLGLESDHIYSTNYFFADNKNAIKCSSVNQCIIGLVPADIVYGVPYVLPTLVVMVALGVTMCCLRVMSTVLSYIFNLCDFHFYHNH
jgi:hypothetical protein